MMQTIKAKDVLAYATMPRIFPRIKGLFASGFSYVAFLMAQIYFMARLLPSSHPYLQSENIGRFGIRHVIAEATRNLKFSLKYMDQIIIYMAMLTGVVMLLAQIGLFIWGVIVEPAMAFSWFDTPDPATDIAYTLLDRVFGVPNIFCSSITPANCTDYSADVLGDGSMIAIPTPFHGALHELFRFYSTGLLLIALLIFLYFVVVIVAETAVSGTPFGQRFQNVWVPIRLIIALALLMPVNFGLNSGQYIVLYAAKYGSSFGTTGWRDFNSGIRDHSMFTSASSSRPTGERYSMLAIPEAPSIMPLIEAMSIVHACAYLYHSQVAGQPNQTIYGGGDYLPENANYTNNSTDRLRVKAWLVKKETSLAAGPIGNSGITGITDERVLWTPTYDYMDALGFYYGGDIIIRFGEYATNASGAVYDRDTGAVKPLCGEIRIPVVDLRDPGGATATPGQGGADYMLKFYYELVRTLWFNEVHMRQFARSYVNLAAKKNLRFINNFCSITEDGSGESLSGTGTGFPGFYATATECEESYPTADFKQAMKDEYQSGTAVSLENAIRQAWSDHVLNSIYEDMTTDIDNYGWGGAGIWYNKIAEVNGGWIDGVQAVPTLSTYPEVMEKVRENNQTHNASVSPEKIFDPTIKAASGQEAPVDVGFGGSTTELAEPLAAMYAYWNDDIKDFDAENRISFKNIFMDSINLLFGTNGLGDMRATNAHLHPLAQLILVGKGLVDSAVRNLATATGVGFLGGALGALKGYQTSAALISAGSDVLLSTAFMGLTAGFVLFYILPFLPFVYFYFAVANWIKAIFEAMVGVPLWALAHLRIDGDGLPGDSAQNGYFLILEIFIRPILTVVGLVAAVIIFSTQVRILNLIWDLVVSNTSGYTPDGQNILAMGSATDVRYQRGIIDQFFFTIIYTIVCYMMALASFKLIDRIPDNILRWAGAGVSSFGDINQEQVDSLSRYAAMGGMTIGNQAAGAVVQLGKGTGGLFTKQINKLVSSPPPTPPNAGP